MQLVLSTAQAVCLGAHPGAEGRTPDGEWRRALGQQIEFVARRQVGNVRLGRDVIEVHVRAKARELEVENVREPREVRLARVAMNESRQRYRVVNEKLTPCLRRF